jgi:hypothetical protein
VEWGVHLIRQVHTAHFAETQGNWWMYPEIVSMMCIFFFSHGSVPDDQKSFRATPGNLET